MTVRSILFMVLGIVVVAVVGVSLWFRNMAVQYETKIRTIQING